ncbi:hypothetical protein D9615_000850 [Tricholomella constricta]|uniref:Protein kinase domain-containing protein n=1 Tax=Tricholomella constricta TaxID=117010 RepID=A0A8H5MBN4_9AGAR|nr:hypothetical protein D9615_000850 [Tricholomella constricta]
MPFSASDHPGYAQPVASSPSDRPFLSSPSHGLALQLRQLYEYQTVLNEHEQLWGDRYQFLLSKGYQLRSRYAPGWTPSWLNMDIDPAYCDDSIETVLPMILDARRLTDQVIVCIKRINPREVTDEVKIAKYLSSAAMLRDPMNHCVPIWDSFKDPILPKVEYIVMPSLRSYDEPEFGAVGEVVDFVTQMLEVIMDFICGGPRTESKQGMEFIHKQLVAHGDLTTQNIMMDARPILPSGWHLVAHHYNPVRYVIIDFDCSVRLSPGQPRLIRKFGGRDGDPPEYKSRDPYDPFKIDVFTLGNVFYKDFYQVYQGLDFLTGLIDFMKTSDFRQRPDAEMSMKYWLKARAQIDVGKARWRLQKRQETVGERVLYDTVAFAKEGVHRMKQSLGMSVSAAQSSLGLGRMIAEPIHRPNKVRRQYGTLGRGFSTSVDKLLENSTFDRGSCPSEDEDTRLLRGNHLNKHCTNEQMQKWGGEFWDIGGMAKGFPAMDS